MGLWCGNWEECELCDSTQIKNADICLTDLETNRLGKAYNDADSATHISDGVYCRILKINNPTLQSSAEYSKYKLMKVDRS